MRIDLWQQSLFLIVIHFLNRLQNFKIIIHLCRAVHQSLHILGETTSTISNAWEQKALANAVIAAHTLTHHIYIRTQQLTQTGNLVHERNLGCQETIGCIFCQFSTACVHVHHRVALTHIRRVQLVHDIKSALTLCANHYTIGLHEIIHCHTFTQELWVTYHIKFTAVVGSNGRFNFISSTHRNRALVYNHLVARHDLTQVVCHTQNVFQISGTAFTWRGWQSQEYHLCILNRVLQIVGKAQTTFLQVALEKYLQSRFKNGDLSTA